MLFFQVLRQQRGPFILVAAISSCILGKFVSPVNGMNGSNNETTTDGDTGKIRDIFAE